MVCRVQRAVGILEHHLQLAPLGPGTSRPDRTAADQDAPRPVADQAGDGAQHRALAGAALANQPEGAACWHQS